MSLNLVLGIPLSILVVSTLSLFLSICCLCIVQCVSAHVSLPYTMTGNTYSLCTFLFTFILAFLFTFLLAFRYIRCILGAILGVHWKDRITNAIASSNRQKQLALRHTLSGHSRAHARYPSTETTTVNRAFIWEAENRRTVDTIQRTTENQPEEM